MADVVVTLGAVTLTKMSTIGRIVYTASGNRTIDATPSVVFLAVKALVDDVITDLQASIDALEANSAGNSVAGQITALTATLVKMGAVPNP